MLLVMLLTESAMRKLLTWITRGDKHGSPPHHIK